MKCSIGFLKLDKKASSKIGFVWDGNRISTWLLYISMALVFKLITSEMFISKTPKKSFRAAASPHSTAAPDGTGSKNMLTALTIKV